VPDKGPSVASRRAEVLYNDTVVFAADDRWSGFYEYLNSPWWTAFDVEYGRKGNPRRDYLYHIRRVTAVVVTTLEV
jgi:hypothetical protein